MLVDRFGNAFQQLPKEGAEVNTGLKWVDGRPIYRSYKKIELGQTVSGSANIGGSNFDYFFIDSSLSCVWTAHPDHPGDYLFYPVNCGSIDGTRIICFLDRDTIRASLSENFAGWTNTFYINYLYVKKN